MDEIRVPSINYSVPGAPPICDEPISQTRYDTAARRSNCYAQAERALVETFHRCGVEPPSSQLQIKALERATSILNAHALDAKEAAERLRTLLADRELEPDQYESVQRQRWMEERRHIAAEELSKSLQQRLSSTPSATEPRPQPSASNSRLNPNLVKFLDTSRHRVFLRSRIRARSDLAGEQFESPRIHHHKHLLPLRLGTQRRRLFLQSKPTQSPPKLPVRQSHTSSSDTSVDSVPPPSTPDTLPFTLPSPQIASLASRPCSVSDVQPMDLSHPAPVDSNGTATIWRESLRSKEEILADLVVPSSIPDYVEGLLAGLDSAMPSRTTFKENPHPQRRPEIVPTPMQPPTEPPFTRLRKSPSMRRISTLLSLPDALSSRIRVGDPGHYNRTTGSWRLSSPPSAFPTTLGSAASSNPESMLTEASGRPLAVSFSGHPSTATLVSPSAVNLQVQDAVPQVLTPTNSEGKVFSRLRKRLSFLR